MKVKIDELRNEGFEIVQEENTEDFETTITEMEEAIDTLENDGIYQQDNARCHTARSVCAWFEDHQDEFTVLPWPANSPDLNPIENLWDYLDRIVRAMDPQPRNLAQLATALESAWLNIPVNTFRNLIDSLPARLAAVRSAKGGYYGF
ncbi:hypothetical protein AVEN_133905-1 [Araneus ventricosus]|uniref:Tc1-like transposase DDE domain-containing protein n=1 Tax=Araneus ventricosus TaxID=182803 RepID=A0A4Y2D5C8_ARAVE|nr:hypothetical protein AVEN_133905-1 [Araneus ventricosus]